MPTVSEGTAGPSRGIADLLYAPIGLVFGPSRSWDELVSQGRVQVGNARFLGEMAARAGSAKLSAGLADAGGQVREMLVRAGLIPPDAPDDAAPAMEGDLVETPSATDTDLRDVPGSPAAEDLPLVDYDSLAASQVVPRLAALKPDELEGVRRYELAHRGRKTILGRVAQLQG